jgi:hypothetical protein
MKTSRITRVGRVAVIVLALAALSALAVPAFATDAYPCGAPVEHNGRTVQYCPLWRGNVPVYDSPSLGNGAHQVDTLYEGGSANWFICDVPASAYHYGNYVNDWWAYTLGDDGRWGWVPEVFFQGGDNNEADAGLYAC